MIDRELTECLPDGWQAEDLSVLICPHGHRIEPDGECPDGCESPLLGTGVLWWTGHATKEWRDDDE